MKSHEIQFFFLSQLSSSPKSAKQFHGALTVNTQQSKLQEGSDGDGGTWKSRNWRNPQSKVGGCLATAASHPRAVLVGGNPGEMPGSWGC